VASGSVRQPLLRSILSACAKHCSTYYLFGLAPNPLLNAEIGPELARANRTSRRAEGTSVAFALQPSCRH
jgi:hypothetical protein